MQVVLLLQQKIVVQDQLFEMAEQTEVDKVVDQTVAVVKVAEELVAHNKAVEVAIVFNAPGKAVVQLLVEKIK